MIRKINLKNNKGISLASVIVTLILAMIILTSIIYSNNRTKEIQKAMLLNSDIEELTKKVDVYYLEKGTLPMVEDLFSPYKYSDGDEIDSDTPVYYKLEISLLENITLNNKEIISESLAEGDQWYVINKETHTIYFVKCIDGKVVPQIAQYSNKYESITLGATEDGSNRIIYNYSDSAGGVGVGNTTINPGIDELIEDTSSIDVGTVTPEGGIVQAGGNYTGVNPDGVSGPGTITNANGLYKSPYKYAGYTDAVTGTNDGSIALHYDGIYNTGSGSSIKHSESVTTWSDISGKGNHGSIVKGTWYYQAKIKDVSASDLSGDLMEDVETTRSTGTGSWNNNSYTLSDNSYILNKTLNNIPTNNANYTIEIVFKNNKNANGGLLGMGVYNNVHTGNKNNAISNLTSVFTKLWNNAKVTDLINVIFEDKYGYKPYEVEHPTLQPNNVDISANSGMNGKANAVRLNSTGTGIVSYYWGVGDIETKNVSLDNNGIYTVAVRYNGTQTQIFVNGTSYASESKNPNTFNRELTIGATNCKLTTSLSTFDDYPGSNGYIKYSFEYNEFFNGTIYSVRIYNKALSDGDIQDNYEEDAYRFK